MSRPKQIRLTVYCSDQQRDALRAAAQASSTDLGTLVLSHALRGIGAAGDVPVVINGKVGAALRAHAERQGVTLERALELLLVGAG